MRLFHVKRLKWNRPPFCKIKFLLNQTSNSRDEPGTWRRCETYTTLRKSGLLSLWTIMNALD